MASQESLKHRPIILDDKSRGIIEDTVREVAEHRGWVVPVICVRLNHVHIVVSANVKPEKALNDFNAWSTRRLTEAGFMKKGARTWGRHGSTKYLWNRKAVEEACRYVTEYQDVER